jgi:hypothetical protein
VLRAKNKNKTDHSFQLVVDLLPHAFGPRRVGVVAQRHCASHVRPFGVLEHTLLVAVLAAAAAAASAPGPARGHLGSHLGLLKATLAPFEKAAAAVAWGRALRRQQERSVERRQRRAANEVEGKRKLAARALDLQGRDGAMR